MGALNTATTAPTYAMSDNPFATYRITIILHPLRTAYNATTHRNISVQTTLSVLIRTRAGNRAYRTTMQCVSTIAQSALVSTTGTTTTTIDPSASVVSMKRVTMQRLRSV